MGHGHDVRCRKARTRLHVTARRPPASTSQAARQAPVAVLCSAWLYRAGVCHAGSQTGSFGPSCLRRCQPRPARLGRKPHTFPPGRGVPQPADLWRHARRPRASGQARAHPLAGRPACPRPRPRPRPAPRRAPPADQLRGGRRRHARRLARDRRIPPPRRAHRRTGRADAARGLVARACLARTRPPRGRGHRRLPRPRRPYPRPAARGDDPVLARPFQRPRAQERVYGRHLPRLRPRPARPCARQFPDPARRRGPFSRDALLPRQPRKPRLSRERELRPRTP